MQKYVYLVGAPDAQHIFVPTIRRLGYKVGLFWDAHKSLKRPDDYDNIVELDFEHLEESIEKLSDPADMDVAGLVCTYENYIRAKARLAEYFGVPGMSQAAAAATTDKLLMRQAFTAANPAMSPRFASVSSLEEARAFASTAAYPLIIKPANLVKSLLVMKCADAAELEANFRHAEQTIGKLYTRLRIYDRQPRIIIEEYITGKLYSVAAFVDDSGKPHFCPGVTSLTNAQDIGVNDVYLYQRTLPTDIDQTLQAELFSVAAQGIDALGMQSTPAHVELIASPDGVKIIEIGARMGGYRPKMYALSHGIDLPEQEIRVATGQIPDISPTKDGFCSVFELFPAHAGTFAGIEPSELAQNTPSMNCKVKAAPGAAIGLARDGYRAAAVITVSSDDRTIHNEACETAKKLRIVCTP